MYCYSKSSAGIALSTSDRHAQQVIQSQKGGFTATEDGGISIPIDGYYAISALLRMDSLGNNANTLTASIRLYRSGSTTTSMPVANTHTGANHCISIPEYVVRLLQGDVLFLAGRNNTGATGNISTDSYMMLRRVQ